METTFKSRSPSRSTTRSTSTATSRLAGLDAARGLAVLAMFVAHGYDAWVSPAEKLGLGYRVTREIAAAALPAFLLFAGVGIGLRWARAAPSERPAVRAAVALRGLRLLAFGYALSVGYSWLDGTFVPNAGWLRADVLHAIGASMLLTAAFALKGERRLVLRAGWLALLVVVVCPPLTRVFGDSSGLLGYALAPLLPVTGVTRFAAIPLATFCLAGVALGARPTAAEVPPGTGRRVLLAGVALAVLGAVATRALLDRLGGALGPTHPALLANAVDGLGRAVSVLALGALLARPALAPLALAGRHSLVLYAAHLPLCYGRLSVPLQGRLDLPEASVGVALLAALALLLSAVLERPLPILNLAQTTGRYRGRGD